MNIVRPITHNDLDVLIDIAQQSGPGFTSLPDNPELLAEKIHRSEQSFQLVNNGGSPSGTAQGSYLFVLEDSETHQVLGTCGIEAAVGMQEPWYHYRMGTIVHASRKLNVHNCFETLYMCNDYTGYSEVCTLFLNPEYRHSKNGTLLSKSRLLFMAQFSERFAERVIAEMRGVSNERGHSPFWEGLGKQFFSMEFSEADYLTGVGNKAFIAELMPKHAIYVHMLPKGAQKVIGQVHKNTQPARKMLEDEGFRWDGYIDIFDAGPTLVCRLKDIKSVNQSRLYTVHIDDKPAPEECCIASNINWRQFRCTLGMLRLGNNRYVHLNQDQAKALSVENGEQLRILKLPSP